MDYYKTPKCGLRSPVFNATFVSVKEHGEEFPREQSHYEVVLHLLDDALRLIEPYTTRGLEDEEFAPEYFLDAAGNLVDIISSDLDNASSSSSADIYNVSQATERRTTIERTVRMIDHIMIIIFQVSASF